MSYEALHNLDIGIPRFLEFSLTVVVRGAIDTDLYAAKLRELLVAWPILTTRMNRLRTKLIQSSHDRFDDIWRLRNYKTTLDLILPQLVSKERPSLIDTAVLEEYFRPPLLQKPTRVTMPPVFELSVVNFRDAAAIKFTVQHPLCDATGLYKIVSAYCSLLSNQPLTIPRPRAALKVVEDSTAEAKEAAEEPVNSTNFAESHSDYYSQGWLSFVGKGIKQWTSRLAGQSRVSRAVLIPRTVVEHWRNVARERKVQVSRNDLLMAWVYMCAFPDLDARPLPFAFVLNIESFLEESGDLHNPWIMIAVPPLTKQEVARIRRLPQADGIVLVAQHFRSHITQARSAHSFQEILEKHQHVNRAPITPKRFGLPEPDMRMSSWANLDLWSLEFPLKYPDTLSDAGTKKRPSSRGSPPPSTAATVANPTWVSGNIDFCPAFQWVNLSMTDTLVTWTEDRGYWIQGKMDRDIWARLSQAATSTLVQMTNSK